MARLIILTRQVDKVLQCATQADPSAFYVGKTPHGVTGSRLTADVGDGRVTVSSNCLTEDDLRRIFAAFLPVREAD